MSITQIKVLKEDGLEKILGDWAGKKGFKLIKFQKSVTLYKRESRKSSRRLDIPFYLEIDARGNEIIVNAWTLWQNSQISINEAITELDPGLLEVYRLFQKLLETIEFYGAKVNQLK